MKKIVVLGSTNTDMMIAGKKIPVPGETISGGKFLMNPGGKGANQVAAMLTLMQNGPVDDAEIYDARAVGGAYAPFFAPETHRPRKAYRVYCAFNELRKLGTAVAPPSIPTSTSIAADSAWSGTEARTNGFPTRRTVRTCA